VVAEDRGDLLALAAAEQAVIDEDAGQPVTDRAVDQRRRDAGIDAAGQAADHPAVVADLAPDPRDGLVDERCHRPVARAPTTPNSQLPSSSAPRGVCTTSGWNCTQWIRRSGLANPDIAQFSESAVCTNPGGSAWTRSPCDAHTESSSPAAAVRTRRRGGPRARSRGRTRGGPPAGHRRQAAWRPAARHSRCRAPGCRARTPPARSSGRRPRRPTTDRRTGRCQSASTRGSARAPDRARS